MSRHRSDLPPETGGGARSSVAASGTAETLARLRQAIATVVDRDEPALTRRAKRAGAEGLAFGVGAVDAAFPRGLKRGALHEVFAAEGRTSYAVAAAVSGFALALARLAQTGRAGEGRALLWIGQRMAALEAGPLHAPGLRAFGLDPGRFVFVETADAAETLWAMEEGLKCPGFAAVLGEAWGTHPRLDMTASRRLQLAAAPHGVMALLVRHAAPPEPGAAETRWRIAPVPAPEGTPRFRLGPPLFDAELHRNRAGAAGRWILQWSPHDARFHIPDAAPDAAHPGRRPAADGDRAGAAVGPAEGARRAV